MSALSQRIAEELKSGLPPHEVAKRIGCSKGYVSLVRSTEGGFRRRFLTKHKIQAAYLWGADHCVTEISQKLSIGELQIIRFLTKEGLI